MTAPCHALIVSTLCASALQAQDTASFRASQVARAEAAGVAYPSKPSPDLPHPTLQVRDGRTPPPLRAGSRERRCVAAVGIGPVQSGEWVIGGEIATVIAGRVAKIWWAPLHHGSDMPALQVIGRSLTPPADSFTFTSPDVSYPLGKDIRTPVPTAERRYFFPSGFVAPRPGVWLLTVTSGPNWGCFILNVTAPRL